MSVCVFKQWRIWKETASSRCYLQNRKNTIYVRNTNGYCWIQYNNNYKAILVYTLYYKSRMLFINGIAIIHTHLRAYVRKFF